MSDETIQDAITSTGQDIAKTLPTAAELTAGAKSFLERAQEAIEDAVESTVEAVKENPITAAAIAAGVVAAAAGAAYGVSTLLDDDKGDAKSDPNLAEKSSTKKK
ncbi:MULTISPECIES: hypothetical protein [unclassified Sphingomonas]|uniref:hypothetical protein n=1 Tax=unclassified Sphingomonas TaxID=196159 RepID=UPI000BCACACB|nr:MAG: hypothetical protein B7Z43_03940 [Sphingomonas sp. 12-62-6]OYX40720.1 MAG: hypothetical protein B7Y98_00035 [Sphingomonas sp. 32-62-10]